MLSNVDYLLNGYGVDLNRNYDEIFAGIWGNPVYGASQNPLSEIYSGPYAFSEPETAAVRNLIEGVMGTNGTPQTVANGFNMVFGPFLNGVKVQDDPFGRIGGPDALSLTASAANGTITLNGSADDTKNGGNKVQAVEVFVDKLGARGTGVKGQLGSSTNSGSITSFTASLSAAGLTSGKHLLIVEAQDDLGQWGAPSAVWVTLP